MAPGKINVNIADINSGATGTEIMPLDVMGLFYFAYRDFVGDADAMLERQGFGRAHHRVLYFVNLKPGMPVADLLDILKITKQSLARVLRQLIDNGYIEQKTGDS
ncbi:MAG: helix-turn-helix domain-containing protein, partial [Devosia sp.]|nr:helix-turn-helix domain-containing protein [Devosia sp.]